MIDFESIKAVDPEICDAMRKELTRQREHLELIASENFVSDAVLSAMGSHLTNKYAEGYPGKRYYGGCQYVDIVEDLARERGAELVISNSHAAETADRLGVPLLRAGIPQYDRIGGYQHAWIGYGGSRQLLFALANALLEPADHGVARYHSIYSRNADSRQEASHGAPQAFANSARRH